MKSMKCDMCEATFQAEDFSGWMEQMKGHYAQAHMDKMAAEDTGDLAKNLEKMKTWMGDMQTKWAETEEGV